MDVFAWMKNRESAKLTKYPSPVGFSEKKQGPEAKHQVYPLSPLGYLTSPSVRLGPRCAALAQSAGLRSRAVHPRLDDV